jgi:hypothetical protein
MAMGGVLRSISSFAAVPRLQPPLGLGLPGRALCNAVQYPGQGVAWPVQCMPACTLHSRQCGQERQGGMAGQGAGGLRQ